MKIIPTCIEILVHKMQEHPVDFIAASHMKKDLSGKTYPTYTYSPILIQGDDIVHYEVFPDIFHKYQYNPQKLPGYSDLSAQWGFQ